MTGRKFNRGRAVARSCALALFALVSWSAQAEYVRVTAANTVNNLVYDVSFAPPPGPGTAVALNSTVEGASHGTYSAVVQVPNVPAGTVDVIAADSTKGEIWRYTPRVPQVPGTPASVTRVWKYAGTGPAHPDGLSIDGAGNLYIVTNKLNDSTTGAVWVLPVNANSPTGYAAQPSLIDGTFSGANGVRVLEDTVVAADNHPAGAWSQGDLLVLVGNGSSSSSQKNSNDADVFVYKAAHVATVIASNGTGTPVSLLGPDYILVGPSQFPGGEYPTGFDFWPADSVTPRTTLLIATTGGHIYRVDFTAGHGLPTASFSTFATISPAAGLNKLKVGIELEIPYAFVTQSPSTTGGQILKLGAPGAGGATNLVGIATASVNGADALAVARAAAVQASSCIISQQTAITPPLQLPCDLSGGVIPHGIVIAGNETVSGDVIEGTCVVLTDPRVNNGVCNGQALDVSTMCPGFGHELIPGTLCGGSGFSHAGFSIARGIAPGVDTGVTGIQIYSQENPDNILPPPPGQMNAACPQAAVGWGPRSDGSEGTIVEVDPLTGYPYIVEMTGFCDNSGVISRGMSVYGIGFVLNTNSNAMPNGLPGYAQATYNHLFTTVDIANIVPAVKAALESSLGQVGTYLAQGDYACAAAQVVVVDSQVASDANPVGDYPGNAANPNPWGEIRGRLANLYMTLNARILLRQPNVVWPITAPDTPPVCSAPVVNMTVMPAFIQPGQTSVVRWTSQHATSCTASDGAAADHWVGSQPVNGSYQTVALAGSQTYSLLCAGTGGSDGTAATVMVDAPPTVSLTAQASPINSGSTATLNWSATDATTTGTPETASLSCTVTGPNGFSASGGPTGSATTGVLTASGAPTPYLYSLACTNNAGGVQTTSATVTVVPKPVVSSFSANPTIVTAGQGTTQVSWAANTFGYTGSCSISSTGGSLNVSGLALSGMITSGIISANETYSIVCTNSIGSGASSAPTTVNVSAVPAPNPTGFVAAPSTISIGTSAVLSWTETTGAKCSVNGGPATSSPTSTGILLTAGSYGFTLSCRNAAGTVVSAASVNVQVVPLASLTSAFSASASSVTLTQPVQLSWGAAAGTSCTASGPGVQGAGTSSPVTAVPTNVGANAYSLDCVNPAQTPAHLGDVTVTAVPAATIGSFAASPSQALKGFGTTLTWSATVPSGGQCTITGTPTAPNSPPNFSQVVAASGSLGTGPLAGGESYTLTCTNGVTVAGGGADPAGTATAGPVTVQTTDGVVAANSAGNAVYDVTFGASPGATTINSDGANHGSFTALVLVPNASTGVADALVADAVKGQILRYSPALGGSAETAQVVWTYTRPGSGPAHPDGLSVDAAGNLYIVTSKLNDNTTNGLWVLPVAASATGFAAKPLLIDSTFTSANGVKTLMETAVANSTAPAWGPGDLLVLVGNGSSSNSQSNSNSARLMVYRKASIAGVLAGGPSLTSPDLLAMGPMQFPAGEFPLGVDFWAPDALSANTTVLMTTTAGRVLRYDFAASGNQVTSNLVQVFAAALGSGLEKIKVGTVAGQPYAFVAQSTSGSSGRIVELAPPTPASPTNVVGSVTSGVIAPDGLAASH